MSVFFSNEEYMKIQNIMTVYEKAQKLLLTKMQVIFESSSIEHTKARIKTPENIAKKLINMNLELTAENAKKHLTDIAGIRIICSYAKDIYHLAGLLRAIPDTEVVTEKDYVSNPKPSGYRSFHVIMQIPVYFCGETEVIPVEVQLRTAAMDFWATLEHKVRYKYKEHIPKHLSDELVICADKICELDERMFLIHDIISLINQDNG